MLESPQIKEWRGLWPGAQEDWKLHASKVPQLHAEYLCQRTFPKLGFDFVLLSVDRRENVRFNEKMWQTSVFQTVPYFNILCFCDWQLAGIYNHTMWCLLDRTSCSPFVAVSPKAAACGWDIGTKSTWLAWTARRLRQTKQTIEQNHSKVFVMLFSHVFCLITRHDYFDLTANTDSLGTQWAAGSFPVRRWKWRLGLLSTWPSPQAVWLDYRKAAAGSWFQYFSHQSIRWWNSTDLLPSSANQDCICVYLNEKLKEMLMLCVSV